MKDETDTALVVKAHRGGQPTHTVGALRDLQGRPLPLLTAVPVHTQDSHPKLAQTRS